MSTMTMSSERTAANSTRLTQSLNYADLADQRSSKSKNRKMLGSGFG